MTVSASHRTSSPTRRQYRLARLITAWYLQTYHDSPDDVGVGAMFCDAGRVGHFAVDRDALAAGDPDALFRVLVATVMFQRRQDAQILRVLRGISREDAEELTDATRLRALADQSACAHLRSNAALLAECDLTKDPETKKGTCERRPELPCHLKRHTVLLKRYGHFGKVPTSAALNLRQHGVEDLLELREAVLRDLKDPAERADELARRLSSAWRVSEKIAAMFLSAVSNPDLSPGLAPWAEGIDWSRYVVVDSNVDLFLERTGYLGPWTYHARTKFVRRLARRVDVRAIGRSMNHGTPLSTHNPRLVQQGIYLFMSESNRRSSTSGRDCWHSADACETCAPALRAACPRLGKGKSHNG